MLQRSKPLTRMLFSKAKIKIDFNKDYYSILGIDSRSNAKTIRLSYLKMVKEHHPDAQPTQSNIQNDKFINIQQAYQVLSNESLKNQYDYHLGNSNKTNKSDHEYRSSSQDKKHTTSNNPQYNSKQYFQQLQRRRKQWKQQFKQQMSEIYMNQEKIRQKLRRQQQKRKEQQLKKDKQRYGGHFYEKSQQELKRIRKIYSQYNRSIWEDHLHTKCERRHSDSIMDKLGMSNMVQNWKILKKKLNEKFKQ